MQPYLRVPACFEGGGAASQWQDGNVDFADELEQVLPPDIPWRDVLVAKAAKQLKLIAEANEYMNLTRISDAREAAVKHVFDCVAPWRHFLGAHAVMDAGTGAGFPGIPLAIVLPEVRFILTDSTQKKARFVDTLIERLQLGNVEVIAERAETLALTRKPDVITARAVAPLHRLVALFDKSLKQGSRLLLYKGPDVAAELAEVDGGPLRAEVICRYQLPDELGSRTLLSVAAHKRGARSAS